MSYQAIRVLSQKLEDLLQESSNVNGVIGNGVDIEAALVHFYDRNAEINVDTLALIGGSPPTGRWH
jgi:hypothetical protein